MLFLLMDFGVVAEFLAPAERLIRRCRMYRTVLVPLDGSPLAERALPYAVMLARASEARLLLVRVVPVTTGHNGHKNVESYQTREAELYLRDVAGRVKHPFVVESAVFTGDPADSIVDEIALRQVDVVVMSTHGRSGLGRWVYGSVADQIMRRASVPVLLVPPRTVGNWPTAHPPRVLVPLDGADLARATLDLIASLVESLGAEVKLLQVLVPTGYIYADRVSYLAVDPAEDLAAVQSYLDGVAKDLAARGWTVTTETAFGTAAATISLAASGGADLIAMSTHGNGGLTRLLMGSVAIGVVQQAMVPVLILRPGEPASREAKTLVTSDE
jgi:nucleotide-binding universal stress UspA family protein